MLIARQFSARGLWSLDWSNINETAQLPEDGMPKNGGERESVVDLRERVMHVRRVCADVSDLAPKDAID